MLAASDRGSYFEQEKLIALDEEEQNRWENETVSVSRANIEGKGKESKDKPAEPDSQESWQKLAGRTIVAGDRLQENLLKSVSCQFCHADVTFLDNVSARSGLGSCWIVSCRILSLPLFSHFSNHNFLGAFAVRSGTFLIAFCTRTSPRVSFPLFTRTLFPSPRHL